jgi:hypothetical protein
MKIGAEVQQNGLYPLAFFSALEALSSMRCDNLKSRTSVLSCYLEVKLAKYGWKLAISEGAFLSLAPFAKVFDLSTSFCLSLSSCFLLNAPV